MKRFFCILLSLSLLLALAPTAGAQTGVRVESGAIGGGAMVYIDMIPGRTGEVVTAGGSVVADAPAFGMVTGAVAAVNGGFFNSYYSGSGTTFPGNCPMIYGALTKNGEIINAGGDNNVIGFTYDGKVLIDRVKFQTTAVIKDRANAAVWAVNKTYDDPASITLLTPALTLPATVPASAKVFTIKDGKVASVAGGGSVVAAAGTKLLVYNAGAVANAQKWDLLPVVGDEIAFAYTYVPTNAADKASWNNLKTAVTGGRLLVAGGANVAANASYNKEFDQDPKQAVGSSSLRSYAAVMKDGRLVLGTASATFTQIADGLIAKGAVSALCFDGGASTMLYTQDGGFSTTAGRELACVLTIVDKAQPDVKPDMPTIPVVDRDPNKPSDWAKDKIEQAKSLKLIPDWMLYGYKAPITRSEFCQLLIQLIPARTGKTADQLRGEKGFYGDKWDAVKFTDTDLYSLRLAAALGITDGYSDGSFRPNTTLSREQAATMLKRTADLLGTVNATQSPVFSDAGAINSWAQEGVTFVTSCGIMNGMGGSTFAPQGQYTKEQAFVTMLNAYNAITPK